MQINGAGLSIASEHEDTDKIVESILQCDELRNAIMGALGKMQRGRYLFDQAARKLEVLVDMSELRRSSSQDQSPGSSDKWISDGVQGVRKPKTRPKPEVLSPARDSHASDSRSIPPTVVECSENNVDADQSFAVTFWKESGRGGEGGEEEKLDQETPIDFRATTTSISLAAVEVNSSKSQRNYGTTFSKPSVYRESGTSFYKTENDLEVNDDDNNSLSSDNKSFLRGRVQKVLDNIVVQVVSVSLILFTFVLICLDTDARAKDSSADPWMDAAMFVCFLAYLMEFLANVYVQGSASVRSHWNYIDGVVITSGTIDYIIVLAKVKGFSMLRLLRLGRLLRVGRLVRALRSLHTVRALKEQYLLLMMMASCVRTVFWAFLFSIALMTVWAILAVEFLNDIVVRLDITTSIWKDCDRCGRSFNSIWEANLTFMQTIMAGDSWGMVALPVIEDSWWTVFIFVGALSTILFGVLNMISAVVIDTFAERRAKDIAHVAKELEYEEKDEKKQLAKMFQQMDTDRSGSLSVEELHEGARKVKEFRQYLRVLDIDSNELVDLFALLDVDHSGEVDPDEFIDALYRMKTAESKTATRFVKYMVDGLLDRTKGLDERLESIQDSVSRKLHDVEEKIRLEIEEKPRNGELQDILEGHADEINLTVARGIEKAVSAALEEGFASVAPKASQAIQEVVASSSVHVAAMNDRLVKSSQCDAANMPTAIASSLPKCQPPRFRGAPQPSGDPIVINAASKTPPLTEWFD